MLLEHFEEKLDPPLAIIVPYYHPAQEPWILLSALVDGEADDLVGEDVPALRQGMVLYDFISGITFDTGNKKDAGVIPLGKEFKVIVAPIHGYNAADGKREIAGSGDVSSPAISDHREVRQIAVMLWNVTMKVLEV